MVPPQGLQVRNTMFVTARTQTTSQRVNAGIPHVMRIRITKTLPSGNSARQHNKITMSRKSNIQWCHSTINPVMGCQGCELWPKPVQFVTQMVDALRNSSLTHDGDLRSVVSEIIGDRSTSDIYRERKMIARQIATKLKVTQAEPDVLVDVVRQLCKCYAGLLGTNRAGHKGYADSFDRVKLFPGRMADAAKYKDPSPDEVRAKPWLKGAPRTIFVSDMGDALSTPVEFEYLQCEIIANVTSDPGRRHLWLWLTKRPERMAQFGEWLADRGIQWPDNLVAMTTVTSQKTVGRIDALRRVPAKFRGLSVEPLFGPVNLPLEGIHWVIVGGGSDALAEPFKIEWAEEIHRQCQSSGAAFFLKQLGKNPCLKGEQLKLKHGHGGDWEEWPSHLRVREIPEGFRKHRPE